MMMKLLVVWVRVRVRVPWLEVREVSLFLRVLILFPRDLLTLIFFS